GVKLPVPSPRRIVTLLEPKFAVARSGLPSRLKSPAATETAVPAPSGEVAGWLKLPVPSPSIIVTLLEPLLAVARSGLPSRLKSPTATDKGWLPAPSGEVAG